ncbi:MAG: prolipoprotein diacylglyceryl transferase [Myxococcales bacterium]|nr:prolipoprotein diacylglyceryl transferase [Myxococcales bacterium]
MHPVLFQLPLPAWTIPLFPALLVLAALGALLALFGYQKRAGDLLVIGVVLTAAAGISAFSYRGQVTTLSPLPIYSYGAMLCVSIVVGWFLTLGLAERDGLPRDKMANCYFVTAASALIGARLLYFVTNPQEFDAFRDLFAFRRGGLVAYGGFIGGFIGSFAYLRSQKIRLLPWADVAVPSLASGLVITRLGCYLFGCDFGKPLGEAAPAWLKKLGSFPRWTEGTLLEGSGSPAWIQHVNQRGLSPDTTHSLPVHPTQLYEVLIGAALLALVFLARKHRRFRGQVFLAFTLGYGYLRFAVEILRDDAERGELGPFVGTHVFLPAALLIFAAAYIYGPSRSVRPPNLRWATDALAVVPPVALYFVLRPASFADAASTQLSTSQWIGLVTGVAAGVAWYTLDEAAKKHPEAAMSLGLGAASVDDEPAPESADEPEPPPPEAAPKKKKKKKPQPSSS